MLHAAGVHYCICGLKKVFCVLYLPKDSKHIDAVHCDSNEFGLSPACAIDIFCFHQQSIVNSRCLLAVITDFVHSGILVARHKWSPSSLGESGWLDVHRLVILFAMISYFTAVIIAVSKFESQHSMIGKTHVVFSVLVFLCLFVQIMLGVFRPKPASSRRQLFSNTHGWLGRSLALLAVFTIFLGISALKTKLQIDVIGWVS